MAQDKGRFRTYLLAALDHFLANQRRTARTAKRGGGQIIVSLDETRTGEERFMGEPPAGGAPERLFDKTWAMAVLDQALARLQEEFVGRGKASHFEDWKVFLTCEATADACKASSERLGMSTGAVTMAVHRLRERYGDLLREAVAHTVADPADLDEELRYLVAVLSA